MRSLGLLSALLVIAVLGNAAGLQPYFPGENNLDVVNPYAAGERGTALMLQHFNEPSLCCQFGSQRREYRFTWFRSFNHPVVIRVVERSADSWEVIVKVANMASWFDFDNLKLIRDESRVVSSIAVRDLVESLKDDRAFWGMPSHIALTGYDGASWLVEARSGDRYHCVFRWSPDSGPIWEIGLKFLALSGLDIKDIY